jgi:CDP-diacylglycerol pyrophosphatase
MGYGATRSVVAAYLSFVNINAGEGSSMARKTQKQLILELLSCGQPVSRGRLQNISWGYNSRVSELNLILKGSNQQIKAVKTDNGWYYSLEEVQ